MNARQKWLLITTAVVWLVAGVGGSRVLLRYASTPGEAGADRSLWPEKSVLAQSPDRHTLVVAIHPRCPCTRASMVELNDLMLSSKGRVKAYVLAMKPREFPKGWEDTDLLGSASRIPDTTVVIDLDGEEAAKFGAKTSGQVALYDERGRLLFNGGITSGRGHIGNNAGRQRILSLVKTGRADKNKSLVFGCPLNAKTCPFEGADKTQDGLKTHAHDS